MIQSKKELTEYIKADLIALNKYPLPLKEKLGGGIRTKGMEVSDKDEETRIPSQL